MEVDDRLQRHFTGCKKTHALYQGMASAMPQQDRIWSGFTRCKIANN
jgi:hypothetical protein